MDNKTDHIYAIEILNDKGEWVRHMYDVPTDYYSIKKLGEVYKKKRIFTKTS